ncbi:MAG: hypothetical protein NTX61_06785 [Bacteroidetes bacterium]|nr:hypothetical protein [Bacteroidota bacterium]
MKQKPSVHKPQPHYRPVRQVVTQKKNKPPSLITNLIQNEIFWLGLLLVLVIIAYFPIFSKEFINLDDPIYVFQNPDVQDFSLSRLGAIFGNFYTAQYSPFGTVLNGIIYHFWKDNPLPYNVFSILLHLTCTILVYRFIKELIGDFRIAFLCTVFFALNPLQVESVAWYASVYKTSLYVIFFLGALIFYIKYVKTGKWLYYFLSLLFFLFSFFCKEQAIALSLVVIAIDYLLKRNLLNRKILLEKIPFLLISVMIGFLTILATLSYLGPKFTVTNWSLVERIVFLCYSLSIYLVKLIVPFNLCLFYPYFKIESSSFYLFCFVLPLILVAFWNGIKKNDRFFIFGILFFIFNLLPTLSIQVLGARLTFMAERYMYLSCLGFYLIIARIITYLLKKRSLPYFLILSVCTIYILTMTVLTYNRCKFWQNTGTIMNDAINKYPGLSVPYSNCARYYRSHQENEKALNMLNRYLQLQPNLSNDECVEVFGLRGNVCFDLGLDSIALFDYSRAISCSSKDVTVFSHRGALLCRMGRYPEAKNDLNTAWKLDKSFSDTYINRAILFSITGKTDSANLDFEHFLLLEPTKAIKVYYNRGLSYMNRNLFIEAIKDFTNGVKNEPGNGNLYNQRSYCFYKLGQYEKAREDIDKASRLGVIIDPGFLQILETKEKKRK